MVYLRHCDLASWLGLPFFGKHPQAEADGILHSFCWGRITFTKIDPFVRPDNKNVRKVCEPCWLASFSRKSIKIEQLGKPLEPTGRTARGNIQPLGRTYGYGCGGTCGWTITKADKAPGEESRMTPVVFQ